MNEDEEEMEELGATEVAEEAVMLVMAHKEAMEARYATMELRLALIENKLSELKVKS